MTQTPNYKLNQWAAEDRILREEFNRDNQRVDDALTALAAGQTRFEAGSYTGSGSKSRSLTFSFQPKLVVIVADNVFSMYSGVVLLQGQTASSGMGIYNANSDHYMQWSLTWSGNSVSWTSDAHYGNDAALNVQDRTYRYLAIG